MVQADVAGVCPKVVHGLSLIHILSVENFDTSLAEDVMLMTPFTASATDDKTAAFVKAYNEAYGEDPNQFAADAYDAIYAIHAAVEKAGVTADMDAVSYTQLWDCKGGQAYGTSKSPNGVPTCNSRPQCRKPRRQ